MKLAVRIAFLLADLACVVALLAVWSAAAYRRPSHDV